MSPMLGADTSWASCRTGITVRYEATTADLPDDIAGSIALGLRRNPRRAQLLVSRVLGKHVPVPATTCLTAGAALGAQVATAATGLGYTPADLDVIGFAETATGLGHQVAAALPGCRYIHTTRRPDGGERLDFSEEHSHATDQVLTPPPGWLRPGIAVLVDDELSSGRTALNAAETLRHIGYRHLILAALLDTRSDHDRVLCRQRAGDLGITLADAAVLTGAVDVPQEAMARTETLLAQVPAPDVTEQSAPAQSRHYRLSTRGVITHARAGFSTADDEALRRLMSDAAARLRPQLMGRVLVVGDEELLYPPQLLAAAMSASVASTTRSPALALVPGPAMAAGDADGSDYPLRHAVRFAAVADPARTSWAYNSAAPGAFDSILLVTQDPIIDHVRRGVVAALASGGATVTTLRLDADHPDPEQPAGTLQEVR